MPATTHSGKPLLEIRNVSRHYGEPPHRVVALDQVNLTIRSGEMVAVMGPSGSGKSTLLTIAGGLEDLSSGSVLLEGRDITKFDRAALAELRRQRIGFVFQGFNLLSGLTAAENIAAPLELDGVPAKTAQSEAKRLLQNVGLGDRADAFPDDLSGGERQRVAIARGLIGDRDLLLADEPTGALDSATSDEIMLLLRGACTPQKAVVVVTHNEAVASRAHRIVRLRDGRIESDERTSHQSQQMADQS